MTDALKHTLELHRKWLDGDGGTRANLSGANLAGATLADADLSVANLSRANLSGADLSGAYLTDADLAGADLSGADLSDAYLAGANLADADLSDANLTGANLTDANLTDANLADVNLAGAIGNMREMRTLKFETWTVTFTRDVIQIGYQRHAVSDWWGFSDECITEMDHQALAWWQKWKLIIRQTYDLCFPAE